jgi:hypothetical protein
MKTITIYETTYSKLAMNEAMVDLVEVWCGGVTSCEDHRFELLYSDALYWNFYAKII